MATDDNSILIEDARLMASERGIQVWKVVGNSELHLNTAREYVNDIYIYAMPQKIRGDLCKAGVYLFQVSKSTNKYDWILVAAPGRSYSSVIASILDDEHALCEEIPLGRYFSAYEPIDDLTLIHIYKSLVQSLVEMEYGNNNDDFTIESIRLSQRSGFIESYVYAAQVRLNDLNKSLYAEIILENSGYKIRYGVSPD